MAYKILLLLRSIMKNIGLKLKDKREENGLSIEEVAEDLKMRPSQILSIEEGKTEDFKDVFYLKYLSRRITNTFSTSISVIRLRNVKAISFYQSPRRNRRANRLYLLLYGKELLYIYDYYPPPRLLPARTS